MVSAGLVDLKADPELVQATILDYGPERYQHSDRTADIVALFEDAGYYFWDDDKPPPFTFTIYRAQPLFGDFAMVWTNALTWAAQRLDDWHNEEVPARLLVAQVEPEAVLGIHDHDQSGEWLVLVDPRRLEEVRVVVEAPQPDELGFGTLAPS